MYIHGMTESRFYRIWTGIQTRCNNSNEHIFQYYGGRGIKNAWNSFQEFYEDMYESYIDHVNSFGEKNTSIDRVNNNGHYSKENCTWSTRYRQVRNRRINRKFEYKGKKTCLTDLCKQFNIPRSTVENRLNRGFSIEESLTTKQYKIKKIHKINHANK